MNDYRVVFSRRARAQIAGIRDYLATHVDEETAERIAAALADRCLELNAYPDRGTPHEDLGDGVRTIPFRRSATIAYVVAGPDVVIIGISWRGQKLEEVIRNAATDS